MTHKIRDAKISDAQEIANIHVKTWQDTYRNIIPQSYLDSFSTKVQKEKWETQIIEKTINIKLHQKNNKITAFIAGGKSRDKDIQNFSEIYAIYVLPNHQKNKIGSSLVNNFFQNNKKPFFLWVLAENTNAINFYKKLGFKHDRQTKTFFIKPKKLLEHRYIYD